MTQFALVTHWHLDAPIDRVWDAIVAVEAWPRWWRYVCKVDELQPGGADGLGALRRYTWASRLPYRLSFEMRISAVDRPTLLEGIAEGDVAGTGRWWLVPDHETTRVRYDWTVAVTKAWMRLFSPILEPAFRWNHNEVMAEGGKGLARHLGVRLLAAS
jgi:hypothetical protein